MVAVKLREQVVCGDVPRALRDGDEQFSFSVVEAFHFHQSLPKKRVKAGLKIEQAERFNSGRDSLVESAGAKMDPRQLRVHEGIVRIALESRFQQLSGFVHFAKLHKRARDALRLERQLRKLEARAEAAERTAKQARAAVESARAHLQRRHH